MHSRIVQRLSRSKNKSLPSNSTLSKRRLLKSSSLDDAFDSLNSTCNEIGNQFLRKSWSYECDDIQEHSALQWSIDDKQENNENFVEVLAHCRGNPELSLQDLLPVQRIPEYDKFLQELLQGTDPGHPDYEHLKWTAATVSSMVKDREDELGNMDHQKHMERVQDKFPYDNLQLHDLDLKRKQQTSCRKSAPVAVIFKPMSKSKSANNILSPTNIGKKDTEFLHPSRPFNNVYRQYLMEGNVEFSRGVQTQDRYLFLFSDLLLVAKQKSNTTFKLKHRIRVCELWISDCVDVITELTRFKDRSFVIGWPTTNYVTTFKSPELKETWLNKFKEQILQERSKVLPKTLPLEVYLTEMDQTCKVEVEIATDVLSVVKKCLDQLNIIDSNSCDYQLWVRVGPDESPYPLCGHELLYAIKLNHIRNYCKQPEDNLTDLEIQHIMNEMQSNNRKNEFFLKHKKSQSRQSLEDNPKPKSKKKSSLINIFRKDKRKPQGKLFGHPLADVTSADTLIAKPVKELLTILFRDGPYTVGILRKSCNAKTSRELKEKLDNGEDCLVGETWPPLVVGTLVKDYLRSIPHSLLKEELFEDWVRVDNIAHGDEKIKMLKDVLGQLPAPNYELLRYLMCILYNIVQNQAENKMTAYNLSVCIGPSLLWPKGVKGQQEQDPLATPAPIIQYMIENCAQIFGEDSIHLFGENVQHKIRQDSGTDSDSMHSILNSNSNLQRDNSSLDSIDREMHLSGEMESSSNILKSHQFSPSNLSGDSGLISDAQFYDDDGNEMINDKRFIRSSSHYIANNKCQDDDLNQASHSLDSQYTQHYRSNNPVPPPRRTRRKSSDPSELPNIKNTHMPKYISQANFDIPARYEKCINLIADRYERRSSESLKSVRESSQATSEGNMQSDIGTLRKSASGSHLYYVEINAPNSNEISLNQSRCHGQLSKTVSEGAVPVSALSKYSSSSRDSVLSDSSDSCLYSQNSPDQLFSPAQTPNEEQQGMSQWVSQQSNYTAYNLSKQTQISHDDIEVGLTIDTRKLTQMNYQVSPKTSPSMKIKLPIPLCTRRSFPLQLDLPLNRNVSNFYKEAEDIEKSPKCTVTFCYQDSPDNKCEYDSLQRDKNPSAHLDIYNNNAHISMKQLNICSSGLQGTSPPPHVVLQELNSQTQAQRHENKSLADNQSLLNHIKSYGIDSTKLSECQQKYPMEESSISSDDNHVESDSEDDSFCKKAIPSKFVIPQQVTVDSKSACLESLSKSLNQCDNSIKWENPPGYAEAVQRNKLLKQGLYLNKSDFDQETKQCETSVKVKLLHEHPKRYYQEQKERYPLPSQNFENKLDVHEEEEDSSVSSASSVVVEELKCNVLRHYEESLQHSREEQQTRFPLKKTASDDKGNVTLLKKGVLYISNKSISQSVPNLNQTHSDSADLVQGHRVPTNESRITIRDPKSNQRPTEPPPYNDPPPYLHEHLEHVGSSPISVNKQISLRNEELVFKHTPKTASLPLVSKSAFKPVAQQTLCKPSLKSLQHVYKLIPTTLSPETVNDSTLKTSSTQPSAQSELALKPQTVSMYEQKAGMLVSNITGNAGVGSINNENFSNTNRTADCKTDYSVRSAQSEIGKYTFGKPQVPNASSCFDLSSSKEKSVGMCSDQSAKDILKSHRILVKQTGYPANTSILQTSYQGPIANRNPNISKSLLEVDRYLSVPTTILNVPRSSLDAKIRQCASDAKTELPWSVKHLSNIFDGSKNSEVSQSLVTPTLSSPAFSTKSVEPSLSTSHLPPPYIPPTPFNRYTASVRSSTSSSSSIGSASSNERINTPKLCSKLGPQFTQESFSSTDESECSCQYSLNCRNDCSSLEELTDMNYTDITYV